METPIKAKQLYCEVCNTENKQDNMIKFDCCDKCLCDTCYGYTGFLDKCLLCKSHIDEFQMLDVICKKEHENYQDYICPCKKNDCKNVNLCKTTFYNMLRHIKDINEIKEQKYYNFVCEYFKKKTGKRLGKTIRKKLNELCGKEYFGFIALKRYVVYIYSHMNEICKDMKNNRENWFIYYVFNNSIYALKYGNVNYKWLED